MEPVNGDQIGAMRAELTALDHNRYPGVPKEAFSVVGERTRGLISQLP
jgi:hypothetical protein